jgi:hypothetical protein
LVQSLARLCSCRTFRNEQDSANMLEFCFNLKSSSGGNPARSVCSMQQALATAVPIPMMSLVQNIHSLSHSIVAFLRVDRVVAAKL